MSPTTPVAPDYEYAIGWWLDPQHSDIGMNAEAFPTLDEALDFIRSEREISCDCSVAGHGWLVIRRPAGHFIAHEHADERCVHEPARQL